MQPFSRMSTAAIVASLLGSMSTLLLCAIAVVDLLIDINEFHKGASMELLEIENLASSAWIAMGPLYTDAGMNRELRKRNTRGRQNWSCIECKSMFDCPAGSPGPPGVPGIPGVPGLPGTNGSCGIDGEIIRLPLTSYGCIKCPSGARGPPGKEGLTGLPGQDGPPGIRGKSGTDGLPGFPGPKGDVGMPGSAGNRGPPGIAGTPGQRGRGMRGRVGHPGPPGPAGKPGSSGELGRSFPGPPGSVGPVGNPGKPGADGMPGRTGEPGNAGGDAFYCPCPKRLLSSTYFNKNAFYDAVAKMNEHDRSAFYRLAKKPFVSYLLRYLDGLSSRVVQAPASSPFVSLPR